MKPAVSVHNGHLSLTGLASTRGGRVPFLVSVPIEVPEGEEEIDFGADNGPGADAMRKAVSKAKRQVQRNGMANIARDLVVRARAGDQNAIALIAATRDAAKQGSKRAQHAFASIKRQVDQRENPPLALPDEAVLQALDQVTRSRNLHYGTAVLSILPGVERDGEDVAALILADGPNIAGERWEELKGVAQYDVPTPSCRRILAEARKIQKIRMGLPFEQIDKHMAWEYPDG